MFQERLSVSATVEVAVGVFGAAGTVVANTVTPVDGADVPEAFVAVTVMVYVISDVSPVTVIGEAAPAAVLVV